MLQRTTHEILVVSQKALRVVTAAAARGGSAALILALLSASAGAHPGQPAQSGQPADPEAVFDEVLAQFEKERGLQPWERTITIEKFGTAPCKKSVEFLTKLYAEEENAAIHIAASSALAKIGTPESLESLFEVGLPAHASDPLALQALAKSLSRSYEPEAEDWLLENAITPEIRKAEGVYALVLRTIARLKSPARAQVLLKELRGQRIPKEIQIVILEALRSGADKKTAQALLPLLRSGEPEIEIGAYEVLAAVEDSTYRTYFLRGLKSPRWEVRALSVDALSRMGEKTLMKLIVPMLQDKDKRVQISVVQALLELGGADVIEPLYKAIDSSDPRVQDDIADALARLTGQNFGPVSAQWESWWMQNKGKGLPLKALSAEEFAALKEEDRIRSKTVYFGLRVVSNHLGFLIDTSQSMGEEYTPKGAEKKPSVETGRGKTEVVDKRKKAAKTKRSSVTTKLDVAKKELTSVVNTLKDTQALNILSFNTLITDFVRSVLGPDVDRLTKLSPDVRARAAQFIQSTTPGGLTNLLGVIEAAAEYSDLDTIYLLSDGAPTVGVTDHQELLGEVERLNRRRRIKINTISFDPKPEERRLLQALSERNFGVYVER